MGCATDSAPTGGFAGCVGARRGAGAVQPPEVLSRTDQGQDDARVAGVTRAHLGCELLVSNDIVEFGTGTLSAR